MSLDVGSVYTASLSVVDSSGAPVNPDTATLTVTRPDQTTTSISLPTLNNPATGLLTWPYTLDQEGLTKFAWATGNPVAAKVDYQNARQFASVISLAEAQDFLGVTDPAQIERIRTLMAVATRYAEGIVGVLVPRSFTSAWVPGEFRPVLAVPKGPILTTTSVTAVRSAYANGPSWSQANGDFVVNLRPGTVRLASLIDFWYGPWLVDYTAGVTVVPEGVEEAVREVLRDLYIPYRGLSVDIAEQAAEGLSISPFYRAPPRAQMLLDEHALPGFG